MPAPRPFLAQILIDGEHEGAGILIRPDMVLTCEHVLRRAGPKEGIRVLVAGTDVTVTCPLDERDPKADLALLRLPSSIEDVEIPEWWDGVEHGVACRYYAFPGGSYKEGDTTAGSCNTGDFELHAWLRSGASGGAVTRRRQDVVRLVGLIRDGEAHPGIVIDKSAVDEFLEAQDTAHYLKFLQGETQWMDLRQLGQDASDGKPPGIDALYHPLRTRLAVARARSKKRTHLDEEPADMPLEQALRERRLFIEGGAGSGKTTFLRRVAWALCREADDELLKLPFRGFPLWIRIRDLDEHMSNPGEGLRPSTEQDPDWLIHFLNTGSAKLNRRLVENKLATKASILLIDGLDEASSEGRRENMRLMMAAAASRYACRFVVTARPGAIASASDMGFTPVRVSDWTRPEIEAFCQRWSKWLKGNTSAGEAHAKGLIEAVSATPRKLRSNPLMLTALAVIYQPDTRLPEERAQLYELIVRWLAKKAAEKSQRDERPQARFTERECLKRLGRLALEMQDRNGKLAVLIGIGDAARLIRDEFLTITGPGEREAAALEFLEEAQAKSGIITLRAGKELEFWHRSFQEYLAAARLTGFGQQITERAKRLLYLPESPEVLPLMAGCMSTSAPEQLTEILHALIADALRKNLPLEKQTHAFGILSAMLSDTRKTFRLDDETKWNRLVMQAMAIFDLEESSSIALDKRLLAAERLGAARDPRLHMPWEEEYWVRIPAGTFRMGATEEEDLDAYPDETPRDVTLDEFHIGRFPVTVREYARYLEDDPEEAAAAEPRRWEEQREHQNSPVTDVSWHQAEAFCRWASGKSQWQVALPSEEQWEFAARGEERRRFPWGDEAPTPKHANYTEAELNRVTPVGLFAAGNARKSKNDTGIVDMAGNVWEWTRSDYDDDTKVVRGASFYYVAGYLRAALRFRLAAAYLYDYLGFRCVRE